METITVSYETDENAALDILPEAAGFELSRPATVRIVMAKVPFTTFGAYEEAHQFLDCTWEGEPCIYPVRILLNQESALVAGREIWGNRRSSATSSGSRKAKSCRADSSAPRAPESAPCR